MTTSRLIELIPMKSGEERRQMRDNARRLLERGGSKAAEAKALLEALDAFEAQARAHRNNRKADGDVVMTVVAAFHEIPLSETDEKLVRVLLENPDASSGELTEKLGWKNKAWQLHFGEMCKRREHLLWPSPFERKRNAPFYCGILADCDEHTHRFTMKPEVVEAFARLGVLARGAH